MMPRNVSFASDDSTAYREHNPPTVLRKQEAARREMSPPVENGPEDNGLRRIVSAGAVGGQPYPDTMPYGGSNAPQKFSSAINLSSTNPNRTNPTILMSRGSSDLKPKFDGLSSGGAPPSVGISVPPGTASDQRKPPSQTFRAHAPTNSATSANPLQPTLPQAQNPTPNTDLPAPQQQQQPQPSVQLQSPQSQPKPPQPQQSQSNTANKQRQTSASNQSKSAKSRGRSSSKDEDNANKTEEVHILVAVTGSVATIKLPLIIHKLKQIYRERAVIQVVVTKASTIFFDTDDIPRDIKVWYDSDEWRSRQVQHQQNASASTSQQSAIGGADQLHIKLRRWADILLVAPCSANTLAKITYGICDNLLTSLFRVWNPEVPIILAPAMNTHMYTNPITKMHFNILKQSLPFVEILKPVEKVLVCGDIGMGGMREWTDIVQVLVKRIGVPLDDEDDTDEDDSD